MNGKLHTQNIKRGNFWSVRRAILVVAMFWIIATAVSACEQQTQPDQPATLEPQVSISTQQSATAKPTSTPTNTPTPVHTVTHTPTATPTATPTIDEPEITKERATPSATNEELNNLVDGNNNFAFDLYSALVNEDENLFFSPYSISLALAMTYGGARGETERQMAETLSFNLPQDSLHSAFNDLDQRLASRGASEDNFRLKNANAVWGQQDHAFLGEYLDLLGEHYGAGVRLTDFRDAPKASRATINQWTAEQTEQRIKDLIPEGGIASDTRLVLTNAIYFNANWEDAFTEAFPSMQPFFMLDGSDIDVAMMFRDAKFGYAEGHGYQALELPYIGRELAMIIIVPDKGRFKEFEGLIDAEFVSQIIGSTLGRDVLLTMPKFEFRSRFDLVQTLKKIGITHAFAPNSADFSGMDGKSCPPQDTVPCLLISKVLHEAFVLVDEDGTEAAAATDVFGGTVSESAMEPPPPIRLTIDRPFIFLIRDRETGTILFLGRIENMNGLSP